MVCPNSSIHDLFCFLNFQDLSLDCNWRWISTLTQAEPELLIARLTLTFIFSFLPPLVPHYQNDACSVQSIHLSILFYRFQCCRRSEYVFQREIVFHSQLTVIVISGEHYKSDFHRYNMKRRVAGLPPVTAAVFTQKVVERKAETAIAASPKNSFCEVCG